MLYVTQEGNLTSRKVDLMFWSWLWRALFVAHHPQLRNCQGNIHTHLFIYYKTATFLEGLTIDTTRGQEGPSLVSCLFYSLLTTN